MSVLQNLRRYGAAPFQVVVVHGGPGAAGEMAPVARELGSTWGVLEPLQTETTLEGQIQELRDVLKAAADLPVTLVGFSWGAWLSSFVAAKHPSMIGKLILVGSGPFDHAYVAQMRETRMSRLAEEERAEFERLVSQLAEPSAQGQSAAFARLGELASKTDTYEQIAVDGDESDMVDDQSKGFHEVLNEAIVMRKEGRLLAMAETIRCPVVAIHGDYDPHPVAGVAKPLSAAVKSFRLHLLAKCGHKPWIERHAVNEFYRILKREIHERNEVRGINNG